MNPDEYFKDHVATLTVLKDEQGNEIERLLWKRPGTSVCMIVYLRSNATLLVYGDLGDAIYQWSEKQTLEWISGLNFGYFAGKCQASEEGRGYKTWDGQVLEERIKEFFKDYQEEYPRGYAKFQESYGRHSTSSRDEWIMFLSTEGAEHFGPEYSYWPMGETIDGRCNLHLEGLKLAFKQLKPAEAHAD